MNLNSDILISAIMDFLFILIFSLLGSIVKDTYNTITERESKVKVSRILVSTIVSTVILFSLSDVFLARMSWKGFIIPCFVGGMVGFDLMSRLTKVEFWIALFNIRIPDNITTLNNSNNNTTIERNNDG